MPWGKEGEFLMCGYFDGEGIWHDDNTGYPVFVPNFQPLYNTVTDYSPAIYNLLLEIKKMLETLLERTKIETL